MPATVPLALRLRLAALALAAARAVCGRIVLARCRHELRDGWRKGIMHRESPANEEEGRFVAP